MPLLYTLAVLAVLIATTVVDAFVVTVVHSSFGRRAVVLLESKSSDASSSAAKKTVQEENALVAKPLTHIKQNKFAPTPEEAKDMNDEQFRSVIYKRMKEAERERRKNGPIGGQSSDDYLDSLSRKKE